jgi:tungstate transport system ATP-binding protein
LNSGTLGKAYLEAHQLHHIYGGKEALNVPHVSFDRSKIYALVGPNGAGKTTLMLILSLLLKPTSGIIYFQGAEVTEGSRRALRGRISMLFQDPVLFSTTVKKNAEYGLRIQRIDGGERKRRMMEALEMVGLRGFEERQSKELSSGEAQRVAIARALAVHPQVLLLDEPTANVDETNARALEEIIQSLARTLGTTVIFSTHNRDQAYRLADEILTLMEGKVVPFSPENIFRGKTMREGEDTWFDTGRMKIFLPSRRDTKAIYIDPKDILVSLTPFASSARNCLEGLIDSIAANGDWVRLEIKAKERLQVLITQRSLLELNLNVGMRVYLTFKSTAVKVF